MNTEEDLQLPRRPRRQLVNRSFAIKLPQPILIPRIAARLMVKLTNSTMADSIPPNCECEWLIDDDCGEVFYKEHSGKRYCVLHYPGPEKKEDFQRAFEARLDENNDKYLNFVGVWFPDLVSFLNQSFTKLADFSLARFSADVEFTESPFEEVRFVNTHFEGQADFAEGHFWGTADFSGARFGQPVSFSRASFYQDGRFFQAQFAGVADFSGVEFEDNAYFTWSAFNIADFGAVRIPIDYKSKSTRRREFETYRSKFKNAEFAEATFTRCTFSRRAFQERLIFSTHSSAMRSTFR